MKRRLWKCGDCGISECKEPHKTLAQHMSDSHGKQWDGVEYVEKKLATRKTQRTANSRGVVQV